MSVQIDERCVKCGACIWECPMEAITPGEQRPTVDAESCTECYGAFGESQCMVVCPVEAITVSRVESEETLAARFQKLCPGKPLQDTWSWRRLVRKAS